MKTHDLEFSTRKNLYLIGLSCLVGLTAGTLASLYRLSLEVAEKIGRAGYGLVVAQPILSIVMVVSLIVLALVIAFFMKKFPMASGSGIPQVKGQLQGYFKPNWFTTAYAKFVAGTLAMLGGLSLGREGPSIQLGASMGQMVSSHLAQTERHKRILVASGASAGLSAAFNAPLSGVMFTLEEVFKYFSPLILLTCMTSAIIADSVSRLFFGSGAVFNFTVTNSIQLSDYWLLIILGIILGIFGAIYNWSLLFGQRMMKKVPKVKWRVMISLAATGIAGLFFPLIIGSGHTLIDQLNFGWGLSFLLLIFVCKFFLSMISYVSGVPGGIFFPLLVLGASLGAAYASFAINLFHLPTALFANFVILAMAGAFTAIVRAPMTGILLLVEMTGSFSHLLPLTVVSLVAYVVADLLNAQPIYDSLLSNMLADNKDEPTEDKAGHIFIEMIVQFDSMAANQRLAKLPLPADCLLIAVHRVGREIVPNGETELMAGDYLTFMVSQTEETNARQQLTKLLTEKAPINVVNDGAK